MVEAGNRLLIMEVEFGLTLLPSFHVLALFVCCLLCWKSCSVLHKRMLNVTLTRTLWDSHQEASVLIRCDKLPLGLQLLNIHSCRTELMETWKPHSPQRKMKSALNGGSGRETNGFCSTSSCYEEMLWKGRRLTDLSSNQPRRRLMFFWNVAPPWQGYSCWLSMTVLIYPGDVVFKLSHGIWTNTHPLSTRR